MPATTPRRVSPEIKSLANRLVPGGMPTFVPLLSGVRRVKDDCFENVRAQVVEAGGEIVYGWRFWEWPNVFLEAEFHAVWRSAGEFHDLSPVPAGALRVLFLEDPAKLYDGRQVDNSRLALSDDPLVREFIRVAEQIFEVMNAGELAYRVGVISLPAEEIEPLWARRQELLKRLVAKNTGRNDPCPCGRGPKVQKLPRSIAP